MSFIKFVSLSLSTIGKFWQQKTNSLIFRWNLVILVLQFIVLFFTFNSLPPQIPLYYSRSWGEAQLTTPNHLIYLPILSLLFWAVNNFLAAIYLTKIDLLSRTLIVFSLLFSFLCLYPLIQIINLVL